jgi:phosphate transport system substrate-binding protein
MHGPARRGVAGRSGKTPFLLAAVLALVAGAIALMACGGGGGGGEATATSEATAGPTAGTPAATTACPPAGAKTSITGAGSTFDNPLFTKWIDVYHTKCNIENNYQSIGSGGGITNIQNGTVDYGASDAILTDTQAQTAIAHGGPILHVPVTLGGVAISANLQGVASGQLKLSPDVLAGIYLGTITNWNDPAIAAINTGLTLPDQAIAVVHRSDGSGTTFIFTDYLSKVSTQWKDQVGSATTVNWPVGVGGDHSQGVAQAVSATPGAIGYFEAAYAIQNNLAWAAIQNSSGAYIEPKLDAISAAATGVTLPDDMKVLVDNSSNPAAYPISGFSWALIYQNQTDLATAQTLANYFWWGLHEGQTYSADLAYAPLPADAVTKAEAELMSMTVNGQPFTFK